MRCDQVTTFGFGYQTAKLTAVSGGSPEDNSFAEATPSASMEITISNPAAKDALVPGKCYYVDFTPIKDAPPAATAS